MGQIQKLWTLLKCCFLWKVVIQAGPELKKGCVTHAYTHTYTQTYLEGRGAASGHLLTLAIPPPGPSLHHFPLLCFLSLHWNARYVYIMPTQETSVNLWSAWSYSKIVIRCFSVNTHIVQISAWRQGFPVRSGFSALLDEQSLCKWQYNPFLANSLTSICKKCRK